MKKGFWTYAVIWALTLIGFNLITFLTPATLDGMTVIKLVWLISSLSKNGMVGYELTNYLFSLGVDEMTFTKYGGAFWPAYIAITIGFVGQLICGIVAFRQKSNSRFFYKLSLVLVCYSGLIATTAIGVLCAIIPNLSYKLGALFCLIALIVTAVAVLKVNANANIVAEKDDEIVQRTSFIKDLSSKAKILYDNADSSIKDDLKKVYEAIRFSDPMSCKESEEDEAEIEKLFCSISDLASSGNSISDSVDELLNAIEIRNQKIKNLKKKN